MEKDFEKNAKAGEKDFFPKIGQSADTEYSLNIMVGDRPKKIRDTRTGYLQYSEN